MFRHLASGLTLLAVLGFSNPNQVQQNNREISVEQTCDFTQPSELKAWIEKEVPARISKVLGMYNREFRQNIPTDDFTVSYIEESSNRIPRFEYNAVQDRFMFYWIPTRNQAQYVRELCKSESKWERYQEDGLEYTEHEAAHKWHAEFIERRNIPLGRGRNPGVHLVYEGVAMYMDGRIDQSERVSDGTQKLHQWFLDGMPAWTVHSAGGQFVRPILDKDFTKGLTYLSQNLPTNIATFDQALNYQSIALQAIQ